MEGTGEGCGLFCSLKLPYLSTMSPIVALKGNLGHNVDTGETAVYRAASVRVILLYAFPRYWPYRRVGSVRFSAEMVPGSCPFAHRIKKV